MDISKVKFDCKYFKGEIPCIMNKTHGSICESCREYIPFSKRILIIKMGAIGDVIRSTPLVTRFRALYKNCHISWITQFPDILPTDEIDEIYNFDFRSVYIISHQRFDIAINLDKEFEACSLLNDVIAEVKHGFSLKDDHVTAIDKDAEPKFLTGLFDGISMKNTKNYLEEIFEICGMQFGGEFYLLPVEQPYDKKWQQEFGAFGTKKIVGLNTGCGARWKTRLWPEAYWIELIQKLQGDGYFPVLLGGKVEDEQNKVYQEETGAYYPGHYGLKEFIAIINQCQLVVTAVSLSMHIAIGLNKHLILFNNIFNKHEFFLYDKGEIIEPASGCDCYYGLTCKRDIHCMKDLLPDDVLMKIKKYL